jgi:glycerate dehydrogenase
MKFVILDGFLVNFDHIGLDIGRHQQVWYPDSDPNEIIHRVGDADGVIVNRAAITADMMDICRNLRYIGTFSTGTNMVDVPAAARRGITVCNVPGFSTAAVAQHTMGLLLEIVGWTGAFDRLVHSGGWKKRYPEEVVSMPTIELEGKTLGIFGAGNIGMRVARLGTAFGMRAIVYRRNPPAVRDFDFVDFDTLLANSDVLSIHAPLTDETRGLFDEQTISRMKDGAILLTAARGAILDEAAVAAALDSGKLYAAGLDVLSDEPPAPDNRLARHPRTVVTPHIGWIPRQTRERLLKLVAANIMAFAAGQPQNVVLP